MTVFTNIDGISMDARLEDAILRVGSVYVTGNVQP